MTAKAVMLNYNMSKANAVIKCVKCGYESHIVNDLCVKCGAPLVKVCGFCGFANSVPKNYCDQCGELMALKAKEDIPVSQTPTDPKDILCAETYQIQAIEGTMMPEEAVCETAKSEKSPPEPAITKENLEIIHEQLFSSAAARPQKNTGIEKPIEQNKAKKNKAISDVFVIVLGGFFVFAGAIYFVMAPQFPRYQLLKTTRKYLKNLSEGRYEDAYRMLSKSAKSACPLRDYTNSISQYYENSSWEFKDIQAAMVEKDAALIKYKIKEGGAEPWKDDFISFVKEDGQWVRPYVWTLFVQIDSAFEKGDYAQALYLAQKLELTDPLDPRTSGYLCTAEYAVGLFDKALTNCNRAINNSKVYPVGFTADAIWGYRYQLADSFRQLSRYKEALDAYNTLLEISPQNQQKWKILAERADVFVWLNNYDLAISDMMESHRLCPAGEQSGINKHLGYLTGDAKDFAVEYVQKSRLAPADPPLIEKRKIWRKEISQKKGGRMVPPEDAWIAIHLTGPIYSVILRQHGGRDAEGNKMVSRDVYKFKVNIWIGSVRLEYLDERW